VKLRPGPRPPRLRRSRVGLHRALAAGLVAAASAVGLRALAPTPAIGVPVLVAARDLPAGHRLTGSDLRVARWAPGSAPDGAQAQASALLGRISAGPLRRGSALTDADLLGPGILAGQPAGLVAVPVRLADPAAALLAHRGDQVDVLAATSFTTVVSRAVVLVEPFVPSESGSSTGSGLLAAGAGGDSGAIDPGGALLVLGVTASDAQRLARAQAAGALSIAVEPR
jgi:pilus assembly protein CpaB